MERATTTTTTTMILVLATLAATAAATADFDTQGVIIEKSFLQSVHDCVEYLQIPRERLVQYMANEFPPDDETKCLLFCVGVDLGWWNSTCGQLQVPAIVSYFQPVQGDWQYEKRTTECLGRRVGTRRTASSSCCTAYETFQCYFQEFGNLVTCPQYVRLSKLQATQAALDCLVMLRYPEELLHLYANGTVEDCPETRCLYHCIDLRTGLYTPETGILLSRFFVRDAALNDLRYLSKETKACRDRVRHSGCDKCSEVYRTHQECLVGLGEDGYTSGLITAAARLALGVSCTTEHHYPPTTEAYHPTTTTPCPRSSESHPVTYPATTTYRTPSSYVYKPKPPPAVPSTRYHSSCGGCSKNYHPSPVASNVVPVKYSPGKSTSERVYNKPSTRGYSAKVGYVSSSSSSNSSGGGSGGGCSSCSNRRKY